MNAGEERISGVKRTRTDCGTATPPEDRPPKTAHHPKTEDSTTRAPNMDSTPFSFEAKIAMALQGQGNWQQLQGAPMAATAAAAASSGVAVSEVKYEEVEVEEDEDIEFDEDLVLAEDEISEPKAVEDVVDVARAEKLAKKVQRFNQVIARDAGDIVKTIDLNTIQPVQETVSWDQDPELLCCYNWQASTTTNTIFVPGEPAKWSPRPLPYSLERDSGYSFADYNYVRRPRDPYSPMFAALRVMRPGYTFNDIDVLADRNNLRVLLEFAQGKTKGPLRLNLYLVHNTLVIVRKESRWWKRGNSDSYGLNFEKHFTRTPEDMQDATSHYRAIRYRMGPLNVVCRFEADAYDDGIMSDELPASEAEIASGGLANLPRFNYPAPITVLQKGHMIPTAQLVELKTQCHKPLNPTLVACQDQLWFGRTPLLITAPYSKDTGTVTRITRELAMERIKTWEEKNEESLRKLVTLLREFRNVLRQQPRERRSLVLVRETKGGPLVLRTMLENASGVDGGARREYWPMRGGGGGGGGGGGMRGRGGAPVGRGQFGDARGRGDIVQRGGFAQRGQFVRGRGDFVPNRGRGNYGLPQGSGNYGPPQGQGRGNYTHPQGRGNYAPPPSQGRGDHIPSQPNPRGNHPQQGQSQGRGRGRGGGGGGGARGGRRSPDHGVGGSRR
ncbi:hypothetical protein P3342_008454 [Pyrenophora teres f. teres]|uniref:Uncharacterized protein n=1 Tax=Pyrenophora teres f. teres TaxID=97479 RepID=A0A6S6W5Z4_9PLEO|nr:hypothetical protein PTNB85_07173 [Pyrenophora teres f. teres]KAE8857413.1 hypothetical protein PTNB29_08480 [Pyrenophora teres f. teres]KAK1910575.1 hypothetical protein P3342_008454 [Pyrenophora teres f. teres]CAE7185923.1 hypothetical protein PTTW11_06882 [Pyrenophora teres f. teres]